MQLLQAMVSTVIPVFILVGLGWVARRVLKVEVKDPATLSVYILSPGLIANSVLTARVVAGEVVKIAVFGVLLTGTMVAITLLLGRLLGWRPIERSAAVLSSAFMNTANYGLPVVLFAFGQSGFDRAAVFVVVQTMMTYTVAVYFAARGQQTWQRSVQSVFRLPLIWAAVGALVIRGLQIQLPEVILKPINLLGNGALVMLIILLGMQVAGIQLKGARVKIAIVTFLRLLVSPVVAIGLVAMLKPEPLTARVLVLESAMPVAVNTTLLAVQFGTEPDQVSGATLMTTLISLITVTFWVWLLQGNYLTIL